MRVRYLLQIVILISFLVWEGCEHAEAPTAGNKGVQPNFESIQTNIFSKSCALSGCHAGSNPTGNMNLSKGKAYDNIVNVRSSEIPRFFRVEPNNPDSSYLVMKLEGSDKIIGQRMPAGGGEPLSQEKINAIRQWINKGAPR